MQRKAAEDPIARRRWEKAGSAQKQSRAEQRREKSQGGDVKKKLVAGENRLENGGLECASAAPHVFCAQLKLGFGSVYSGRSQCSSAPEQGGTKRLK